jgi:hypothetical protein
MGGMHVHGVVKVTGPAVSLKDISGRERKSMVLGLNKTVQRSVPCDVKNMEALVNFGNGMLQIQQKAGPTIVSCIHPLRNSGKITTSGLEMRHACDL